VSDHAVMNLQCELMVLVELRSEFMGIEEALSDKGGCLGILLVAWLRWN
jgi:hypothetical protein